MLTLNLNLLYTVVNILVLFLLLRKFLYKPVMNIIAQRTRRGNTVEDLPVIATDPLLTASKPCVDVDIAHGRPFQ